METHLGGEYAHTDNCSRIIMLWNNLKWTQKWVNISFTYVLQYNGVTGNARNYLHDLSPTAYIIYKNKIIFI